MKKNKTLLLIILLVSIFLVLFFGPYFFGHLIPMPTLLFNSCDNDNECILVDKDCCGCGGDGQGTAINKKYTSVWNKINNYRCAVLCNTIESDHPSCSCQPKCVNNKCELIPKK